MLFTADDSAAVSTDNAVVALPSISEVLKDRTPPLSTTVCRVKCDKEDVYFKVVYSSFTALITTITTAALPTTDTTTSSFAYEYVTIITGN